MKKRNTKQFIEDVKKVHSTKYDYSLVKYINNRTKVEIICPEHGIFEQRPYSHISGQGCPKCGGTFKFTINDFIIKSKEIHGNKYDYSKSNYIDSTTPIKIICKKHGIFEQLPSNHIHHNTGCPLCANIIKGESVKLNTKLFIKKSKKVHGNKYDYSLVDYINTHTKVKIICKKHGIFEQQPNSHLNGRGCNICNNSKGEIKIKKYLIDNNINFIQQKTFKGCYYKKKLRFDFYLPEENICIEYNGIQHYESIKFFGGDDKLIINKKRFSVKENYCHLHNIKLIIIKYNVDNINEILTSLLN